MLGRVEQWAKNHLATIGLVAAVAAVVALWPIFAGLFGGSGGSGPGAQTPSTTATSSTTSPPTTEGPALFWSAEGAIPAAAQSCAGLVGYCIGGSLEAVVSGLGPADLTGPAVDGSEVHTWHLADGLHVAFTSSVAGSLSHAEVTTVEEEGMPPEPVQDQRVALPGGLVFGSVSMGEVEAAHDPILDPSVGTSDDEAQGVWVAVCFLDGPEAIRTVMYRTYVSSRELEALDLPLLGDDGSGEDEMLRLIADRPVQEYAVGLEQTMRGLCGV